MGLAVLLAGLTLWLSTDISDYGGRIFPVTRLMITPLAIFDFFALIIAIYYAGELVWREKELRTKEIIDATPVPDWMFVGPKTVAISLVLISTLLVGMVVAITMQAVKGYFNFEIGKYLLWWVLPQSIDFVLLAALAIFIQTLSSQKYVGWAVMAVYLISTAVLASLGFEHHLYQYGGGLDRTVVGYGRPGPLLDRRVLDPALLERVRAHPAGDGIRPVAARDRDASCAAPSRPAAAAARNGGRHSRNCGGNFRRIWRLHLLQHQCPQPLSHSAR